MNRTLNHAFPIVAAALGNKLGVKVRVGGENARTDGEVIELPSYDGSDPDFRDVAWGYLAHEAGHVRFTDMDDFALATEPLRHSILNVLEDVRIERCLAEIYPGTRLTIEKAVRKLMDTGAYRKIDADSHPATVLHAFLLYELRAQELGQTALRDLAENVGKLLDSTFPPGMVTRLHGLLSDVPDLASTRGCLRLTDQILRMIQDELEKAQNPEPSSSQQQDDDSGGDQTDHPNSSGSDGSPQTGDTGNAPDANRNGTASGTSHGDASNTNEQGSGALQQLLSAGASNVGQDLFEAARDALALDAHQGNDIVLPVADEAPRDTTRGRQLLDKVRAESGLIRASLQGMVQASRLRKPVLKRMGNRVNGSRLTRIALGDARIFERQGHKVAPNTAVHLLVDRSPSMDCQVEDQGKVLGTRMSLAWEASAALVLALEGIDGVNPALSAFPGSGGRSDRVYRVMGHGQRVGQREAAFGEAPNGGGTPLAEGLWYAASQVLACRESRKVILVLTDGQPGDADAARDILSRCAATDIEVVGVGLGIDVQHLFPQSIAILQIHELRLRLFALSKDLLIAA
jgi:hypothetical protein